MEAVAVLICCSPNGNLVAAQLPLAIRNATCIPVWGILSVANLTAKEKVMVSTNITATDPVCGMTVNPGEALHSEHEGRPYFFCSAGCQRKFEEDPYYEGRRFVLQ